MSSLDGAFGGVSFVVAAVAAAGCFFSPALAGRLAVGFLRRTAMGCRSGDGVLMTNFGNFLCTSASSTTAVGLLLAAAPKTKGLLVSTSGACDGVVDNERRCG